MQKGIEQNLLRSVLINNKCREEKTLDKVSASFSNTAKIKKKILLRDERTPYAHDADKIIHCNAYARYMDKTQVFFQIKNDHITKRSLHVQMVSKIARTIGRFLRLNEDLIEAVALGHDLVHTPFGHAGESELAKILESKCKESFVHNAQSVRVLEVLENNGEGLNLTLQTLDGIIGHNGEFESKVLECDKAKLSWENLKNNLSQCFSKPRKDHPEKYILPSTLEGCVVRISDIISYLGRDFEDAIALKLIERNELPDKITNVLGDNNSKIINTLCRDVVRNSIGQGKICLSDEVFNALVDMKKFNTNRIYKHDIINDQQEKFSCMMKMLFDLYLDDLNTGNEESGIFKDYLSMFEKSEYKTSNSKERVVADFIAGMTDQYFINQFSNRFIPSTINYNDLDRLRKLATHGVMIKQE